MAYIVRVGVGMHRVLATSLLALSVVFLGAGCAAEASSESSDDSALVGGQRDQTFAAGGYLTYGADAPAQSVACNATLIAPRVVVTAAHCVLRHAGAAGWSFGTGDVGRPVAKVTEVHVHPKFHAEAQGTIDIQHALRMFDVAYLVLDEPVQGVHPAAIPTSGPRMADAVHAIGYHGAHAPLRMGASARVMLSVDLAGDPIFEVHPTGGSALCVADGDEGSPVFAGTPDAPVLVGFFVGSVTQGITDCVRGSQYLDGYESSFGYREFFAAAIAAGG